MALESMALESIIHGFTESENEVGYTDRTSLRENPTEIDGFVGKIDGFSWVFDYYFFRPENFRFLCLIKKNRRKIFDDFFFGSHISMLNFPKIPKIILRKLCDEAWYTR